MSSFSSQAIAMVFNGIHRITDREGALIRIMHAQYRIVRARYSTLSEGKNPPKPTHLFKLIGYVVLLS